MRDTNTIITGAVVCENCKQSLENACSEGALDVVEHLLLQKELDANPNALLERAVSNNRVDVLQRLLRDNRFDPSVYDCRLVRYATEFGHWEIVDVLLKDKRVESHGRGHYWAFLGAAVADKHDYFETLFHLPGVDPSGQENIAIRAAASRNDFMMMQLLLDDGRVDPSDRGNEALLRASYRGHQRTVDLLVADPRVYSEGKIPSFSLWSKYGREATALVRSSVLRLLSSGGYSFDVEQTFSTRTLAEEDVRVAMESCHEANLLRVQLASLALRRALPVELMAEVIFMAFGNSFFPWLSADARKTEVLRTLCNN